MAEKQDQINRKALAACSLEYASCGCLDSTVCDMSSSCLDSAVRDTVCGCYAQENKRLEMHDHEYGEPLENITCSGGQVLELNATACQKKGASQVHLEYSCLLSLRMHRAG